MCSLVHGVLSAVGREVWSQRDIIRTNSVERKIFVIVGSRKGNYVLNLHCFLRQSPFPSVFNLNILLQLSFLARNGCYMYAKEDFIMPELWFFKENDYLIPQKEVRCPCSRHFPLLPSCFKLKQ